MTDSRSFEPVAQSKAGTAQLMVYAYALRTAYDAAGGVVEGTFTFLKNRLMSWTLISG